MKVTGRDIAILVGFSLLVTIGCVLVVRRLGPPPAAPIAATPAGSAAGAKPGTAPRSTKTPVAGSAVPEVAFVSTLAPGTIPPQYSVIVERKLFSPLIAVAKPSTGGGGGAATPPGRLEIGNIPPLIIGPSGPLVPRQVTPPTTVTPPAPSSRTSYPPVPLPPLALTGFITAGGITKASIENLQFATSRTVGVGDSVWGWRVVRVDRAQHRVVVRPDTAALAKAIELRLGEGKSETGLASGYAGGGNDEDGPPGMPDAKGGFPGGMPPGAAPGMPVPGGSFGAGQYGGRRSFRGGGGGGNGR